MFQWALSSLPLALFFFFPTSFLTDLWLKNSSVSGNPKELIALSYSLTWKSGISRLSPTDSQPVHYVFGVYFILGSGLNIHKIYPDSWVDFWSQIPLLKISPRIPMSWPHSLISEIAFTFSQHSLTLKIFFHFLNVPWKAIFYSPVPVPALLSLWPWYCSQVNRNAHCSLNAQVNRINTHHPLNKQS